MLSKTNRTGEPTSRMAPAILCFFLILCVGCQSNLTVKRMNAKNPLAKNAAKTPTKMVDVWQTYVETGGPDGKPMRGIGGRIHFYADGKKKNTVKVDGDLSVFVFDGEETNPARAKPLKVYQFKAETLSKHYAFKKPLGHGYDFFLPFDELGGEEKTLCILSRFDDRLDGGLVVSAPVNTILKGTKRDANVESSFQEYLASRSILGKELPGKGQPALNPNDITQVAFRQSGSMIENKGSGEGNPPDRRPVATITLNDHMTRRLSQSNPSSDTAAPGSAPETAAAMPSGASTAAPVFPQSQYEPNNSVAPAAWNRENDHSKLLQVEKINYPKSSSLK